MPKRFPSATSTFAGAIALTVFVGGAGLLGQSPAPAPNRPSFEVASIRKNVSLSDSASVRGQPGGRLTVTNNTLRNIIRNAYNVQNFQIVGGPEWINNDRWDIVAKAADDAQPQQMLLMLQSLLADRFKLVIRREMRDTSVYALVLARSDGRLGPGLRPSSVDCAALVAAARGRGEPLRNTINGRPACGTRSTRGSIVTTAVAMADFARNLSPQTGRAVVDRTGLSGTFDIDLMWTPDQAPPGVDGPAPPASGDGVSLFAAIQEQLGLKLDAQRAPVDTLVIDSAERPVED